MKPAIGAILTLSVAMATHMGAGGEARASDRALLIGVGNYADPAVNDLPGIDLDVEMARDIATTLGFDKGAIKVLADEQATQAAVEGAVVSWLGTGVGPTDRVLLYFSGHGTQIPDASSDEADGADEVLVLHDAGVTRVGGRPSLRGVLVDDRLGELLAALPTQNVLVLIDACHSGTVTRSLPIATRSLGGRLDSVAKSFDYPGMPTSTAGVADAGFKELGDAVVAVTAARDDETARASRQGSYFTLGVHESMTRAAGQRAALTPEGLTRDASSYIVRELGASNAFHPQLTASAAARVRPLRMGATGSSAGAQRQRLEEVVRAVGATIQVRASAKELTVGDRFEVTVDVPSDGYLQIVTVGPDGVPTVLFPNSWHPGSRVTRGVLRLPTPEMQFDLQATRPTGESYVAVFYTSAPLDLYTDGFGDRSEEGFRTLSPAGTRSLQAVRREASTTRQIGAGELRMTVRD